MGKTEELKKIKREAEFCTSCDLWLERNKLVFGEGNPDASLLFLGESPGQEENKQGEAFVGKAGKLFNRWIKALGFTREQVYICNIIKCKPPGNRDPNINEVNACILFLKQQIKIIQPKIIILLGAVALKALFTDNKLSIKRCRGIWRDYDDIPVMPTFHPAFLLRQMSEENKRKVESDLKKVVDKLRNLKYSKTKL